MASKKSSGKTKGKKGKSQPKEIASVKSQPVEKAIGVDASAPEEELATLSPEEEVNAAIENGIPPDEIAHVEEKAITEATNLENEQLARLSPEEEVNAAIENGIPPDEIAHVEEKAITEATNLENEELATLSPEEEVNAAIENGILPDEIAHVEEKAITGATNLENEQLATLSPEEEVNAAIENGIPPDEIAHVEEKAIGEDQNLANEQLEVIPQAESAPVKKMPPRASKLKARLPDGYEPRPMYAGNPYLPRNAKVVDIIRETATIRTLRLVIENEEEMSKFTFLPGQVGQISVYGAGEATFVINSPPSQKEYLQFSIMKAGEVTDAIHRLNIGDTVGLRAPLGNYFPYADWKGKNVFLVGGGIGMAPIRTIMYYLLEHKEDYGRISLLYGARSPQDMAYGYELDTWMSNPDLDCTLCIDNPQEGWKYKVGLIPKVLEELKPNPENCVAVLCGPPIMIKFTLESLKKLGFKPENIITTLEKRMKCGIGICGRCNIGDRYVCVDGPVFTLKELNGLPPDI